MGTNEPVEFLHQIMDLAIQHEAADIHFKVNEPPIITIKDSIVRVNSPDLTGNRMEEIMHSLMSEKQRSILEENLELDFSYQYNKSRFRINVAFEKDGMYSTLRLIPDKILPITKIGFPNEVWKRIVSLERGLILVTGVTGSGKTTTLASLINEINKNYSKNIITIEDPIEYVHNRMKSTIRQRELDTHTKSFYNGVKYALRQKPNVIPVGEIRDPETAREVLNASETGHLVFSTEHAKDSQGAIIRFLDLFKSEEKDSIRASFASNIEYIIAQQLVAPKDNSKRVLAMEIMQATYGLRAIIRKGDFHQIPNQMIVGRKDGEDMITMDTRLIDLYQGGIIKDKETVLKYCIDTKNTESLLSRLS